MQRIRVATYNVHKCIGMDRRVSPQRIAEVINEVDPDVVGLQEVLAEQAEQIASLLRIHVAFGEVRRLGASGYGNVVLSRFPLKSWCTFDLSAPGRERRGCVRTDVLLGPGSVMHLFNFHLGTDFMERRWQAQRLLQLELMRSKDLEGPRVVLGDFNEWTRGLVSQVLSAEFQSADRRLISQIRRSYPGVFPLLNLDHIYYDKDLVVERVGLHRSAKSLVASDHLPLWAEFSISR